MTKKDALQEQIDQLEQKIELQEERTDISDEEIVRYTSEDKDALNKIKRHSDDLEELDDLLFELNNTLNDYQIVPDEEDKENIIDIITKVEGDYSEYLTDDLTEFLGEAKKVVNKTDE